VVTREVNVERYLVEQVEARGAACRKFRTPGYDGAPDRILLNSGRRIAFCETKKERGRFQVKQPRYIRWLRKLGFPVAVCESKGQVDKFISELEKGGFFK
jgi:hypothetical protein